MHTKNSKIPGSLKVGDDAVTLISPSSTSLAVIPVLGRTIAHGIETLYLDRLIHEPHHDSIEDWSVSGAIVTQLSRPALG